MATRIVVVAAELVVLLAVAGLPLGTGSTTTLGDPVGDEIAFPVLVYGFPAPMERVCHDSGADMWAIDVADDGTALTVTLHVVSPLRPSCGAVELHRVWGTRSVHLEDGWDVVRLSSGSHDGLRVDRCVVFDSLVRCAIAEDDYGTRWSLPLAGRTIGGAAYDLSGRVYEVHGITHTAASPVFCSGIACTDNVQFRDDAYGAFST